MERVKCGTPDLAKQNLEKLKALFPGVVTEGPNGVAIDVEALRQECSATPLEGNVERYEFTWPGKRAAKAAASAATTKTLRPCREESVNFDTTETGVQPVLAGYQHKGRLTMAMKLKFKNQDF